MDFIPSQPDLSLQIGLPTGATPHDHHHHAASINARFFAAGGGNGGVGSAAAATAPSLQLPAMPISLPLPLPVPMYPGSAAAAGPAQGGGGVYYHPDAAVLRPIRGVPLYQHHPQGAVGGGPCFCEPCHVAGAWRRAVCGAGPRFPQARRAARAPRMRWTSTLHTRFVHAVELLGGHDRT
jgi:hypothetical protein